jgi:hypothetical protein
MSDEVKYPEVWVNLIGQDGNAFYILGAVSRDLRKHGVPQAEVDKFVAAAKSAKYDDLLRTVMRWVTVI